jgi:hypothetical protein
MVTIGNGSGDMGLVLGSDVAAENRAASDRALREKNRFWFEKPATRFGVYFCVFVASEILVGITLHWIFHII